MSPTLHPAADSAPAPLLTWSRAFPATPVQAREARRFLSRILDGRPFAEDAVLCLGELAANATIHSRSRNGGHFIVRAQLGEGYIRVEVHDQGGPWTLARTRRRTTRARVTDRRRPRPQLGCPR
jgi:anti-sigma regulatory factor (Ser/Thr protein kinase)